MDKPRCQGCLGELKAERPDGGEPYVWCLRCGARDDREPLFLIAWLEQQQSVPRPRESIENRARHAARQEHGGHSHVSSVGRWERRGRSPDAG